MSSQAMSAGDPYCSIHGFNPCRCWYYGSLAVPNIHQQNQWQKFQGQLAQGTQICVDMTKPQEEVPVKKVADELKQVAAVAAADQVESHSAWIFFLERAKKAAKQGQFRIHFWMSKLPWTRPELDAAAESLRKDNFTVNIRVCNELRDSDTEIVVSWQ